MEVVHEVHLGRGGFTWKVTDLQSKWNINTANEDLLRQALTVMGADAGDLPRIVGSILDWMDPDDMTHVEGAETDYYQGMSPAYEAKNAPIDNISELLFVQGVTREIFLGGAATNSLPGRIQQQINRNQLGFQGDPYPVGLADLFTPISGGRLNINTASVYALQLVPGMDPQRARSEE